MHRVSMINMPMLIIILSQSCAFRVEADTSALLPHV